MFDIEKYVNDETIIKDDKYETFKEYVICSICDSLMIEPVICLSCQNNYCKKCIEKWRENGGDCPNRCENPTFKDVIGRNRLISKFKFKCINGCGAEILFDNIKSHYDSDCPKKKPKKQPKPEKEFIGNLGYRDKPKLVDFPVYAINTKNTKIIKPIISAKNRTKKNHSLDYKRLKVKKTNNNNYMNNKINNNYNYNIANYNYNNLNRNYNENDYNKNKFVNNYNKNLSTKKKKNNFDNYNINFDNYNDYNNNDNYNDYNNNDNYNEYNNNDNYNEYNNNDNYYNNFNDDMNLNNDNNYYNKNISNINRVINSKKNEF